MGWFVLGLAIGLFVASLGHMILSGIVALIVMAILIYNDPGKGLG